MGSKLLPPDQIFVFDDVISNELCDYMIKIIDETPLTTFKYSETNNVLCDAIHVDEMTNCEKRKKVDGIIYKIINTLAKIFTEEYAIQCIADSGYILRKITGPTRMHRDSVVSNRNGDYRADNLRLMSVIIALNDYEGGSFVFPEQKRKIHLKRGQVIAFPPYWTHQHATEELKNNTVRYTINTWLCGI